MTTTFATRTTAWALASAALLLTAGCASTPPTATQMAEVPMGTVNTYHRKSSGSLGVFDGAVPWTLSPSTWQGRPVLAYASPAGTSLHLPTSHGLVANLNPQGQPVMSYDPSIDAPWPLQVGKTWTTRHTVTLHPSGRTVPLTIQGKVESYEAVTVPAGTYQTFKLVWTNDQGETETRWVAPADGISPIKRHVERPASHPQGAGVLDAELLSSVKPAK